VVVNYRGEDAAEALPKVDRIVEVAINENLPLDLAVMNPNAVVSAYANGTFDTVPVRELMVRNILLRFVLIYTIPREALQEGVDDLSQALRDGVLSELPPHRFPLDQIADAHDAVENGAVGKVFVEIP